MPLKSLQCQWCVWTWEEIFVKLTLCAYPPDLILILVMLVQRLHWKYFESLCQKMCYNKQCFNLANVCFDSVNHATNFLKFKKKVNSAFSPSLVVKLSFKVSVLLKVCNGILWEVTTGRPEWLARSSILSFHWLTKKHQCDCINKLQISAVPFVQVASRHKA